jgi:tRNA1(Val) A37 N6-methylase TrmN6
MQIVGNTKKNKKTTTKKNKTNKKIGLKHFPTYFPSDIEKENISTKLNPTIEMDLVKDYGKLQSLSCTQIKKQSAETRVGNRIVDHFTLKERLHTKGQQKIDFYTFWKNRAYFRKVPYIKKMLDFYKTRDTDEIRKFKYIFNLYLSSISIFRPILAMELYCMISAKRVLDFTMGWGGRLLGAHVLNLESYIGIDINAELREPYDKMVSFLREQEKTLEKQTQIQLIFRDALKVDYSILDYDTVFTSPPYYDYEEYRHMKKYKWKEEFYEPIIKTTWKYLKKNGHFCLNVPEDIYDSICVPILGKCHSKLVLKKKKRTKTANYKEFIYIWKKV